VMASAPSPANRSSRASTSPGAVASPLMFQPPASSIRTRMPGAAALADAPARPPCSSISEKREKVELSMKNSSSRKMTSMSEVSDNGLRLRTPRSMRMGELGWCPRTALGMKRGNRHRTGFGNLVQPLGDEVFQCRPLVVHPRFEHGEDDRDRHGH